MEAIWRSTQHGLLGGLAEIALVFSNEPQAPGLQIAKQLGLATCCIPSTGRSRLEQEKELLMALAPAQVDFLVLAGYLRILSEQVLNQYPHRVINIHPADTALHRGLGGYEWAHAQRLSSTKITVHWVDAGLDTGEIIAQREVDLRGAVTLEEVKARGLAVEHELFSEALYQVICLTANNCHHQ